MGLACVIAHAYGPSTLVRQEDHHGASLSHIVRPCEKKRRKGRKKKEVFWATKVPLLSIFAPSFLGDNDFQLVIVFQH